MRRRARPAMPARHRPSAPARPTRSAGRATLAVAALASTAALVLAACGGGGDAGAPPPPAAPADCLALPDAVRWFAAVDAQDWNDVLVDAQQRVWLAGWAGGRLGESNLGPSGDSRAVLQVLDAGGRTLWDSGRELDSPGTDVAEALALSPGGTVFVAGRSTGALGGANAGQFDSFVAWHDAPATAAGWRRFQHGDAAPQQPRRLGLAGDGALLLAGHDEVHVVDRAVQRWADPFALRLESGAEGGDRLALRWQHRFETAAQDTLDALAVAADGATYLGGSAGGSTPGPWVRKLDAAGRQLWHQRYAASAADNIAALRMLPDGSLLVAGTTIGSFQGGTAHGQQDAFVARLAAEDGRVLAVWQHGSAHSDWVTDMAVDRDGNIVVLGETLGTLVPGQVAAGASDLFLLRLAPDGRLLAARQWGTAEDELARRVAVDRCGRIVAVGASQHDGRRAGLLWFWAPDRP